VTHVDNSHHLRRAAVARDDEARARTREVLVELERTGGPVTFTAAARAAGVSRSWLYTQPDLRDAIIRLRQILPVATTARPIPAGQRASTDSLRQRLDAARAEITRLRAENAVLREQLARDLGARRAHH
jgi:hypothetical protein